MNQTNHALATAEQLIRARFDKHFGDRYRIDSIVGSSFSRKEREVNYITVYLSPGGPPLDHRETSEFDILLKEEMANLDIHDWPAIAFVTRDHIAS